jgi:flagellar biosynthesis protein FlhG
MQNNPGRSTTTICVASGKGGVGKTTFSVNLAVALGNLGNKVLLFDGDMGLANAQIALDCTLPSVDDAGASAISSYLSGLEKLLIETRYGVTLLPGMNGNHALANMSQEDTFKIVRNFSELSGRFDYLIIDSAAGLSESILALLQASDIRLVIGTNEPASITDAYGLLKTLNKLDVLEHLYFIPNKCRTPQDGKALFEKMQNVVKHFLAMNIDFIGSVSDDQHVNRSWKKSMPFLAFSPKSQVSLELNRIADRISKIRLPETRSKHLRFFG